MSRPHRVPLALLLALSAFSSSAQQLPTAYVARLAAQPWQCAGPDLAVVPCGRSRIADECRFRLAYLAACAAAGPKVAPARAALQACVREANPTSAGGMALAFLTFDKAAAAAIAAASPACPHLRGVKAAPGAALETAAISCERTQ